MNANLFDVIELVTNVDNHSQGTHGAIVGLYPDQQYLIEFSSKNDELCLAVVSSEQFIVVWQAETARTEQLFDVENTAHELNQSLRQTRLSV